MGLVILLGVLSLVPRSRMQGTFQYFGVCGKIQTLF